MSKGNTSTVKQLKEVPSVMTCMLEHTVTKTTGKINWNGPKIDPDIWRMVLAFFKWTYDEHKSESQVRLFVNGRTQQWGAWAFPQEARTGMSARELPDHPNNAEGLLMFAEPEGWLYFGTVHHHCGMGAFQSGTDLANESCQDGLHITVGKMDEKKHDMHCRLYISGHRFEPDLGWFWDVEETLRGVPQGLRRFMSDTMAHRLAYDQMCEPAPEGTEFPQQWKDNVIDIRPVVHINPAGTVYQGGLGVGASPYSSARVKKPYDTARDVALSKKEFEDYWSEMGITEDKLMFLLSIDGEGGETVCELIENLYRNDVSLKALIDAFEDDEEKAFAKELDKEKDKDAKGNGVPDYEGHDWSGYQ